ncbi:hypothetical protein L1987_18942 [Smallanthus sonchifolius]|uniref:Uncharacterized protein n=1 Tax=Smallanthus sonchifolius TaxID=185202 RepID=A0ACB9J0Y4_9ASTR|nr:hypothetical protein L1987_18942 [Smallanthus sonchifolius]
MDVVVPSREKYKRLYETVDVKEFSDRDLERMAYLAEHGKNWDENFEMSANNNKIKQIKNMKTETLKKLVNEVKSEKENEKRIQIE